MKSFPECVLVADLPESMAACGDETFGANVLQMQRNKSVLGMYIAY